MAAVICSLPLIGMTEASGADNGTEETLAESFHRGVRLNQNLAPPGSDSLRALQASPVIIRLVLPLSVETGANAA